MLVNFKSGINESIIEGLSKDKNEPEWMLRKRLNSFKLFKSLEEPTTSYGIGITNNTKEITLNNLITNQKGVSIENKGVIVETFEESFKNHPLVIKENFMTKCVSPLDGKYIALHNCLWNNGILIIIPRSTIHKNPINIMLINKEEVHFNNILIIAEEDSEATILINRKSNEFNKFSSNIIEVISKDNSTLNIINLQNLENETNDFSTTKMLQRKNSKIIYTELGIGANTSRSKVTSVLDGEEANFKIFSLNYCNNNQNFDVNISAIHKSKFTYSNILSTNILDNKSKLIFNGLIRIEENSSNSVGYQKEENLLLSKEAEVYPIPNLEINNYDVKCSHGASTTSIDDDKTFYLMSRGLSEEKAKQLIVKGYFNKFISTINNKEVSKIIKESIKGNSKYATLN